MPADSQFPGMVRDLIVTPGSTIRAIDRRPSVWLVAALYLVIAVGPQLVRPTVHQRWIESAEQGLADAPDQYRQLAGQQLAALEGWNPRVFSVTATGLSAIGLVFGLLLILPALTWIYGLLLKGRPGFQPLLADAALCFIVAIVAALPEQVLLQVAGRGAGAITLFWTLHVVRVLWFFLLMRVAIALRFRLAFDPQMSTVWKFFFLNWVAWLFIRDPISQRVASLRWAAFVEVVVLWSLSTAVGGLLVRVML